MKRRNKSQQILTRSTCLYEIATGSNKYIARGYIRTMKFFYKKKKNNNNNKIAPI